MIETIEFYEVKEGKLRPRQQQTITFTKEQQEYVLQYYGKKTIMEMSFELDIHDTRLYRNMRLMKLYNRRSTKKERQYLLFNYTK